MLLKDLLKPYTHTKTCFYISVSVLVLILRSVLELFLSLAASFPEMGLRWCMVQVGQMRSRNLLISIF